MRSGFDRLARPYRWLEYLSFGRSLERCRLRFVPELAGARNALLLGDGDGRFAARLVTVLPLVHVHAVDSSPAMLAALMERCSAAGAANRVTTETAHLPATLWPGTDCWDLVATHFFLDCLSQQDTEHLVNAVASRACPQTKWILSEFHVPQGRMRLPAQAIVTALYSAFRMLTGLRVRHLPDYASVLQNHGFERVRRVPALGGLLTSELWILVRSVRESSRLESGQA